MNVRDAVVNDGINRPSRAEAMANPMTRPLMNFRLKPEVAEVIRVLAAEERRPVSQFLANLVEDAISKRESALIGIIRGDA